MTTDEVLILGCGYTGRRVAARLLQRGLRVTATTRNPGSLAALSESGATVLRLDVLEASTLRDLRVPGHRASLVIHSIPPVEGPRGRFDPTPKLLEALEAPPARIVYLSTTSVYGRAAEVSDQTPVDPLTESAALRLEAELAVSKGPWSWLVLRAAAIYGPWRGVHRRLLERSYRLPGDGTNFVSRIHVDDLAAHVEAGLLANVTGVFPVGDEAPCESIRMAGFCADLLGVPCPQPGGVQLREGREAYASISRRIPRKDLEGVHETIRFSRRVDGGAIRAVLGLRLAYPTYREGVPACLRAEAAGEPA